MSLRIYTFVLTVISSFSVLAQDFKGEAVGSELEQVKKLAIADLQQNIYVKVDTQTLLTQSNTAPNTFKMSSNLSSTFPLLGLQTECSKQASEHHCVALLLESSSATLYRSQIEQIRLTINDEWQKANSETNNIRKYQRLSKLLNLFNQMQPLSLVAELLSPEHHQQDSTFQLSQQDITTELLKLEQEPTSLEMLALSIANQFKDKPKVFIKPLSLDDSLEITPFAAGLQAQISKYSDATSNLAEANYIFSGNYHFNKSHIQTAFTVQSNDQNGNAELLASGSKLINIKHIDKLRYEPTHIDFDRLLKSEQIVDDTFIAKIQTNKGSRDLLFFEGETIKLLVKVNKPSYIYMVGHSRTKQQNISYLLDLKEAKGNAKFVNYLGNDEVNKWVILGEFEVHPPFGVESLQLFASTKKPYNVLPKTEFDGNYFQIKGSSTEVINKTRGLIRKGRAKHYSKPETSESVLSFTTRGK